MLAHALNVLLQIAVLILRRFCIHILLVGHQRHLRVDDGILSLRVVQYHVGLHLLASLVMLHGTSQFVAQTGLHLVVYALGQSLRCKQVAQYYLAHVSAHLVVAAQHIGQALSLLTQLLCLLHHHQHLLSERCRMGSTLLLVVVDGLLHIGYRILQRLSDARHGLGVRLLKLRSALLKQLLCHILESRLVALQFLGHLLMQQLQLTPLRFGLGMQVSVLGLKMLYSTGLLGQLFGLHLQFDISLAACNAQSIHTAVHQQIEHHGAYRYTYYNIQYNHHLLLILLQS